MNVWKNIFGEFEYTPVLKEQINDESTVSFEALSEVINENEEETTPMDENEGDEITPPENEPSSEEMPDPPDNPEDETTDGGEPVEEIAPETDPMDEEAMPEDGENPEEITDDTVDDTTEPDAMDDEPIEAPETGLPDQELNGKHLISNEILNLLDEIKRAIDRFNESPLENKSIVVNDLLELQDIVKNLNESVIKLSLADLQLRYALNVRTFNEIVKV